MIDYIDNELAINKNYGSMDHSRANIGFIDFALLMINWSLVVISSVVGLGTIGGALFILLSAFLMLRNVSNTILIWILFFFVPDVSISFQIPSVFRIILILSGIAYIYNGRVGNINRYINSLTIAVFCLIAFFTLLLPISPNLRAAFGSYVNYVQGLITLLMLLGLINDYDDAVRIMKWWAVVAGLSVIPALIHLHLGYSSFLAQMWLRIMGEDAFMRIQVEAMAGELTGRLLWPGASANGTSVNLIFPFGVSIGLLISERKKVFWFIITALIYIALLGTFSRSGFLTSCLIIVFFIMKKNVKALIPAIAIAGFALLIVNFVPAVANRIFSIKENIEVTGGTGRFHLWAQAIGMWLSSPFWGNGLESVIYHFQYLTHNTYLQLLAETGIVGFGIYAAILVIVAKSLFASRKYAIGEIYSERFADLSLGLQMGFLGVCLHLTTITYTVPMYFFWQCGLCFLFSKTVLQISTSDVEEFNEGIVYNPA